MEKALPAPPRRSADPGWWYLGVLLLVSTAYEALFVNHGIAWLFDEGWPLYAAMRLHAGGGLYDDVFFAFPPGHLLGAWVAYGLDPPGIVLARVFYAVFDVALCLALYLLGRRVMPAHYAFFGALLLAVAAPRSHLAHLLFGYRYLVFSVLALLALSRRLRGGDWRFSFAAGVLAGLALVFRLTPAFAVSCGIGLALLAHASTRHLAAGERASSRWLGLARDLAAYAGGLGLVATPVLAWFAFGVGLDVVWREVVTRIVALQSAQSLAGPEFSLLPPSGTRRDIYRWFIALQFRLYVAMYAGYALALAALWWRSLRGGAAFPHALLIAIVVWGGVYLLRALGRSDDHHLMSALPPACLVLAHVCWLATRGILATPRRPLLRAAAVASAGALLFAGWVYAQRVDLYLERSRRGAVPIRVTNGAVSITSRAQASRIDRTVRALMRSTRPQDIVLDLTGGPLLHVLSRRAGPGHLDVVIPGIFLDESEERALLERLRSAPPVAVIWPRVDFDDMSARSIERTAPLVAAWVLAHYEEGVVLDEYAILRRRGGQPPHPPALEEKPLDGKDREDG